MNKENEDLNKVFRLNAKENINESLDRIKTLKKISKLVELSFEARQKKELKNLHFDSILWNRLELLRMISREEYQLTSYHVSLIYPYQQKSCEVEEVKLSFNNQSERKQFEKCIKENIKSSKTRLKKIKEILKKIEKEFQKKKITNANLDYSSSFNLILQSHNALISEEDHYYSSLTALNKKFDYNVAKEKPRAATPKATK